jgi:hypothetical protein
MPFGRTGKHNNRSQHNLVGQTVGAGNPIQGASSADSVSAVNSPNNPPPASSNTAFSSSESFDTARPNQPQPPQPPQHTAIIYGSASGGANDSSNDVSQLHHSNTVSGGAYDSRRKDTTDFADLVSRSQSQRFPQQQISPVQAQQLQIQQQQQHYGHPSGSVDNLHDTLNVASPVAPQGPPPQQHQQLPQGPPPKKQSTRKLIKNILTGSNNRGAEPQQQVQQVPQSAYHTGGLARRPSKRVSNPPPTIRTGISQVSLEQPPFDWQTQVPPTIPSPQQASGEFRDLFVSNQSNQELLVQNPQDFQQTSGIRQVPADVEHSPYSAEDVGAYHQQQGHIQLQGATAELLQQQFNQAAFDQQQQQLLLQHQQQQQQQFGNQQAQYQGNSQLYPGHLGNPQQQNPETVSQLSHESPITDSDQRSATVHSSQPSPGVNYPLQNPLQSLQTQDLPASQNPHSAQSAEQAQTPQQNMAPPPTGPPPRDSRRSQETEKPPPGPPPSYRHSQQPNLGNMPPSSTGGQTPGNYRQSSLQERQGFDGAGAEQGRNSPQPGSDRGDGTEDKAFKDLRKSPLTHCPCCIHQLTDGR